MQIINNLFYVLPYIFIFLIVALIYIIITNEKKVNKLNLIWITVIIVIGVILIIYYLPRKSIFRGYNFTNVTVTTGSTQLANIKDKVSINKIFKVIDKYTFIRSAVKTVEQQNVADNQLIELHSYDLKKHKVIHLYLLNEQKKNLLQINEQIYNSCEKENLNNEILKLLKELNIKY